ncbi:MAG TPA: hypothetical protein VF588_10450 [Pyrinomonadaceae bacterium]
MSSWRERVESLGLDPEHDAVNYPIVRSTHRLEEFKRWYNAPPHPTPKKSDLTAARVAKLPDALMRRHVVRHVLTGESVIEDPKVIKALEERVKTFHTFVQSAADITVTASNPLVINFSSIVLYGTVTVRDGGYIRITADCNFQCGALNNVSGAPNMIQVLGVNGQDGQAGDPGQWGYTGLSGVDARCDCCGGRVAAGPTSGVVGSNGSVGGAAKTVGGPGRSAPTVVFSVTDNLPRPIQFLNQGGDGGRGGDGGAGGQGGRGGNGGDGVQCGAMFCPGANGSRGGNGGNGGNASDGGEGGTGGRLSINVPAAQISNVSVTLGLAPGGPRGTGGLLGRGGPGGAGGRYRGQTGPAGRPGDTNGNPGQPGKPGKKGSAILNGRPTG